MKKILFTTLIILFVCIKGNAQTKMPKNISDDFAYSIIYSYKNRYENTGIFIMQNLRRKGYDPMDIDVLVESIVDNIKNRNIILEIFHDYFGKDKEYLYANLVSLGISATNSKYLTDYIIEEKYKSPNVKNDKVYSTLNSTSKSNTSNFFTGKKKFCDEFKAWYYVVTIEKDNITFELYPDPENEYHKDKNKPKEIVKGKIIGDIIKIPRPENCEICGDEYETGRFKYKNGILYDANIEDGYNEYFECGDSSELKSSIGKNDFTIYNGDSVDVKPDFTEGMANFYKFFYENFKTPENETIKGKINANFVVEKDGSITGINIIRDLGHGTGKEAVRVLKLSPKWIPAKKNGVIVRSNFTLVISLPSELSNLSNSKSKSTVKPSKSTSDALSSILNDKNEGVAGNKGKVTDLENDINSFKNRKVLVKPSPEYKCNEEGTVVVEVTVNKNGEVINARAGVRGSTTNAKCLLEATEKAALNTKFEPNENAPDTQNGVISYNFKFSY